MKPLALNVTGPDSAPVLVLSGSLGSTREMWNPQMETLTQHLRVIRIDHPGHGESPVWDEPVTIEGIATAVLDALDHLHLDRVSFCGLSLGGAVGQWLAAHAPERIDRLVLCATSARFQPAEVYLQRAEVVRKQGMATISAAVIERWFTPAFHASHPQVVEEYRAMLESISPEGYAACCEAVAAFDGRADLAAIAAPTLVIVGEDDPATTVEHAGTLHDGIRGARLQIVPEAAHLVNVEQPAAVGAAILEHVMEERHG